MRDNKSAIESSQKHLLGLIKYYEGDRHHYYEGHTASYRDAGGKGTLTGGFGSIKKVGTKTNDAAYADLEKNLVEHTKYVIKKAGGFQEFKKIPASIREALIDLSFNKGADEINKTKLSEAITTGDWSSLISMLRCLNCSNKIQGKQRINAIAGLHRRSLSRAILALRDLKGNELKQAKAEVEKIYNDCVQYYEDNKLSLNDVNAIWSQYNGNGSNIKAYSAESAKHLVAQNETYENIAKKYCPEGENVANFANEIKRFNNVPRDKNTLIAGRKINIPLEFNGKYTKTTPLVPRESKKPEQAEKKQAIAKPSEQETISVKQDNDNFYVIKTGQGYLAAVKALFPKVTEYKQQKALADLYEKELGTAQEGMVLSYSYSMAEDLEDFYISDEYKGKGVFAVAGKIKEKYPNLSISQGDLTRYIVNYNKEVPFQVGKTLKVPRFEIAPLKIDEESDKPSNYQEEQEEKYSSKSVLYEKLGKPRTESVKCKYSNISFETYSYVVGKSEGYWGIANKFGIAPKTLINSNGGKATPLDLGQKINIPRLVYTLQKGESIEDIAKKLGVSVPMLKDMNDIEDASKELKTGFKLAIPGYLHYVKSGENLTKIAKNAGVEVEKLEEINNLKSDKINPNQKLLILYNDVNYDIPKRNISETKPVENVTPNVSEIESDTEEASIPTEDGGWKTVSVSKLPVEENVVGKNRPYFRVRQTGEEGQILATREVFTPDKKYQNGPLAGKTIIVNAGHGYQHEAPFDDGTTEDAVQKDIKAKNNIRMQENKKNKGKRGYKPKKMLPLPPVDNIPSEARINYDNAMILKDHLLKQGARVIYLQGGVWEVADEIPKPENKADMFISIHADSQIYDLNVSKSLVIFPKEEQDFGRRVREKGKVKLYSAKNNSIREQGYKKSRQFAYLFDRSLDNGNDKTSQDKEVNELVTQVARNQGIPSLLWEVDFITSQAGRDAITDPKEMGRRCNLVCDSVVNYFQEPEYLFDIIGENDSIDKIAKRNGCTQKKILELNPHLFKNIHGEPTPKQLVRIPTP